MKPDASRLEPEPLLLASSNSAKLRRLAWLCQGLPVLLRTPFDLSILPPRVDERGPGFLENAVEKALAWSDRAGGILVLASDGGLRIPALAGQWNELFTRRNAGDDADGPSRVDHLLSLMHGLTGNDRACEWCEALALARDGNLLESWTACGSGGVIMERPPATGTAGEFWTESIRMHKAAGKLYRDMSDVELAGYDTVWPALRDRVRTYFLRP